MRTIFIPLLLIIFAGAATAQEMTYRYEDGKTYKYMFEGTGLTIQEIPGRTITVNTESTITADFKRLEQLEDGHQRMQATIENALVIEEGPEQTQTKGADAAGKSIDYEIDRMGNVVDVDTSIAQLDEDAQQILGQVVQMIPDLDASKFDDDAEWTEESSDTLGKGENQTIRNTETTYSITGHKDINGYDCYEIKVKSDTDIDGKMARGDQEMMISGTTEGKGTIYYAVKEGLLVKLNLEVNGDRTIMFPSNNMRIPITTNQVLKGELLGS